MQAVMPRELVRAKRRAPRCEHSGKQSYRTKRKALKFAERTNQMEKVHLYVYRCQHCPFWHLTSQVQRAKAA